VGEQFPKSGSISSSLAISSNKHVPDIIAEGEKNFSVEFELIYTIGRNASGRLLNMAVVVVPKTLITS
jgi:hypothetical protein